MKKLGIFLVVLVAFFAYDIYNIRLPEEAVDTSGIRIYLYFFRLFSLKV